MKPRRVVLQSPYGNMTYLHSPSITMTIANGAQGWEGLPGMVIFDELARHNVTVRVPTHWLQPVPAITQLEKTK